MAHPASLPVAAGSEAFFRHETLLEGLHIEKGQKTLRTLRVSRVGKKLKVYAFRYYLPSRRLHGVAESMTRTKRPPGARHDRIQKAGDRFQATINGLP